MGKMKLFMIANYSKTKDKHISALIKNVYGINLFDVYNGETDITECGYDCWSDKIYPIFVHDYTIQNIMNMYRDWSKEYKNNSSVYILIFTDKNMNTDDIHFPGIGKYPFDSYVDIIETKGIIINNRKRFNELVNNNFSKFCRIMPFVKRYMDCEFDISLKVNDYKLCDVTKTNKITMAITAQGAKYETSKDPYIIYRSCKPKNNYYPEVHTDEKAVKEFFRKTKIPATHRDTAILCGPSCDEFSTYIFKSFNYNTSHISLHFYKIQPFSYMLKMVKTPIATDVKVNDHDTITVNGFKYEVYLDSIKFKIVQKYNNPRRPDQYILSEDVEHMLDQLSKMHFMDDYEMKMSYMRNHYYNY